MKKIIGLAAIAMLAMGSFAVSHAAPGAACEGPVDASCTVVDQDGNTQNCDLFISAGTDADGCTQL